MSRVTSTDYLILGGGCSGLTSAISAREAGVKDVTVIEVRKIFGGSGRMQMSLAGVDTPYQRRHGVHVHADDFAKEVTHANHYMQNNKLIWEMFMDSSDRHAWLESLGVEWQDVCAMTGTRRVAHIHETGTIGSMDTGVVIMDKLLEEIDRIHRRHQSGYLREETKTEPEDTHVPHVSPLRQNLPFLLFLLHLQRDFLHD